ncbi:hypothetical protein ACFX1Q_020150 [Malus domestica]
MVEMEIEEPLKGKAVTVEEEKTHTPEESLASYLSIKEVLRLPKEMQRALIAVLASLEDHEMQQRKGKGLELRPHEYATCCVAHDAITFTNEDLLLGSKPHNRPIFISGYVREHKVNRMLVDGGSTINIISKSTMTTIDIKVMNYLEAIF